MKSERICTDCDIEFTEKNTNKGKINQCRECSESDGTNRHIGYNDGALNKSQNIAVYRGDSKHVKKILLGFRMV